MKSTPHKIWQHPSLDVCFILITVLSVSFQLTLEPEVNLTVKTSYYACDSRPASQRKKTHTLFREWDYTTRLDVQRRKLSPSARKRVARSHIASRRPRHADAYATARSANQTSRQSSCDRIDASIGVIRM